MKKFFLLFSIVTSIGFSQPEITSWQLNNNGQKASFWLPNGAPPPSTSWTYTTTTDSASILRVCYRTDSVWIYSHGMVFNMGKYYNPGSVTAQYYIYRFPRTPQVPATKVISPKIGAIGCLVNGIPIYGLGDSKSWNGSTNIANGPGIWNVEVYMGEGISLDTALSAHPQQTGAYHSHAKPRRLYQGTPITQHSPLIGFAFDGYPVYGPYGYSTPTNSTSAITRMKSGYSLRSITTRTSLPYNGTLTASQYGPAVSATYPIGTYCEDYEWLASNGGDLDKYNGRFCMTPEYPGGTYAYFVTIDASGTPQFPYYVGIEYYGQPDTGNMPSGPTTTTGLKFPATGLTCLYPTKIDELEDKKSFRLYPNPNSGSFVISIKEGRESLRSLEVINTMGQKIYGSDISWESAEIVLPSAIAKGIYFVRLLGDGSLVQATEKIMVE